MKNTNIFYKSLPSIINIALTFILSIPLLVYFGFGSNYKISWAMIFLLYNLVFELFFYKRDPGMIFVGTFYEHQRTTLQKILYVILYTLSFSTLLFYIWVPFDLFLINILFIQLPCVLITKNTFHGFLAGNVKTVKGL